MTTGRVAVVMPAFDEADGIAEFLLEIDRCLSRVVDDLVLVVVDDASPAPLGPVLEPVRGLLSGRLDVVRNERNLGHGPSALRAYRRGLSHDPAMVIHVDGDGQFSGHDFPLALARLAFADVVHGARTGRDDPWYRRMISRGLRSVWYRNQVVDANTPLRAYRSSCLAALLSRVPETSLVPHLHFSRLEPALGLSVAVLPVVSRPRRGATQVGTMWRTSGHTAVLPPRRLLSFCVRAAGELLATYGASSGPHTPALPAPARVTALTSASAAE